MSTLPSADATAFGRMTDALLAELREVLGEDALRADPVSLEAYSRDETEDLRHLPEAVVLPAAVEQVQAVLRIASRERLPITPRGAGTGLSGGALPVAGGLVLSLERLDRIRGIHPTDRVAEVEAGVRTAELRRRVEEAGLFYPPDPGSAETCMLGGNLAEDAAGPLSCLYGTTRRFVLGLEAVLADGTLLRTGGRNRKDVTGYNLTQLLVGSEGTLAVLTAAVLELLPRPGASLSLAATFDGPRRAAAAVAALFGAGHRPAACELLDRRAVELATPGTDLPATFRRAGALLLLRLHGGDAASLLPPAEGLETSLREAGATEVLAAADSVQERRLWAARSRVGEAVKEVSTYKEIDAVVPRSALAALVEAVERAATEHGVTAVSYGHAGDGNLHVNLLREGLSPADWTARRDAAEDAIIGAVLRLHGAPTAEHGVGLTQRRHLVAALGSDSVALQRRLKEAFDPHGILNPGKVLP